jgi:hypothetical protein
MNATAVRICGWCGILSLLLFIVGFFVAGLIPPQPPPDASAFAAGSYFREHAVQIRVGLTIASFGAALFVPWAVSIGYHMHRMEGGRFAPLAWTQMIAGGLLCLCFNIPFYLLMSATFRPERSDEAIQSLVDSAWLIFIGIVSTNVVQGVFIGIAVLGDRNPRPVWPRWVGYFSIWAVILPATGALVPFFKTGPFTWRGLLVWWVPLPVFVGWILTMSVLAIRSAGDVLENPADQTAGDFASAAEVAQLRQELRALRERDGRQSAAGQVGGPR